MPCSKVCMFTYLYLHNHFFTVAVDWCNIPGMQKKIHQPLSTNALYALEYYMQVVYLRPWVQLKASVA